MFFFFFLVMPKLLALNSTRKAKCPKLRKMVQKDRKEEICLPSGGYSLPLSAPLFRAQSTEVD